MWQDRIVKLKENVALLEQCFQKKTNLTTNSPSEINTDLINTWDGLIEYHLYVIRHQTFMLETER